MPRRRMAVALASVLFFPALAVAGEDLDALLRKSVEAYGGVDALSTLVFRQKGRLTSGMREGKEGTIVRSYRRPDHLRVEVSFPGEETEIRALDGDKGWSQGREAQGMPFHAMTLQAARFALPLNLLERKDELKDLGTVSRDGKTLRAVELPLGGNRSIVAEIDPESGRILRSTARSAAAPGMGPAAGGNRESIEFATTYGDFRTVKGVLFPFREGNYAMGQHTGDTVIEKVDVLRSLPADTFQP